MVSDDFQRPRRKASPTQAAYLAVRRKQTQKWRTLWRTEPQRMETARRKATLAAALKVQGANRWLTETVKAWPETFTAPEFLRLASDLPYVRKGRKRRMPHASLVRRLRSMGLISYDPALGLWLNLCRNNPLTSPD